MPLAPAESVFADAGCPPMLDAYYHEATASRSGTLGALFDVRER